MPIEIFAIYALVAVTPRHFAFALRHASFHISFFAAFIRISPSRPIDAIDAILRRLIFDHA